MGFAWRLVDPRYVDDLEGSGNRVHGARWNSPGRGVLYCSENLSLCVLETLVHLPPPLRGRLPRRIALKLRFPDDAGVTEIMKLPRVAKVGNFRELGDRWLEEQETLVLRAPSVIVRQDHNVMINPSHPRMKEVEVTEQILFVYDDRLLRPLG